MLQHVLSVNQYDRDSLSELFTKADFLRSMLPEDIYSRKKHKRIATIFYEPSTRTRLSFESAAQSLGMDVISTENAKEFSSASKGETVEDTVRTLGLYTNGIVMRHYITGSIAAASEVSEVPIINAGDGSGEHPTQAFLDLYTILRELGTIDNITIAMVGDLLYGRTVHSLTRVLKHYHNIMMYFVSPPVLAMPPDVLDDIKDVDNIRVEATENLADVLGKVDILYMTRIQRERFPTDEEYLKYKDIYTITPESLPQMRDNARILHPLPRVSEISTDIDTDPRAAYFRQAQNGLYLRMALLDQIIS